MELLHVLSIKLTTRPLYDSRYASINEKPERCQAGFDGALCAGDGHVPQTCSRSNEYGSGEYRRYSCCRPELPELMVVIYSWSCPNRTNSCLCTPLP